MKHTLTTPHLLLAALALAFAASTAWVQMHGGARPADGVANHETSPSPGFSSAFGNGPAVRNLLW